MQFTTTLHKMPAFMAEEVKYLLPADQDFIRMNDLLGRELALHFLNQRFCESCGGQFKSLYRMGFCRECFFNSPLAGESIIRPELSRAHEGVEDRDLNYEKSYQLQPHVVYLAISGGLKVGVTRKNNRLTRWIDQGASQAMVFAETSNRYEAGMIEVALKEHLADKTNWQRMLKNEDPELDLLAEKQNVAGKLAEKWRAFVTEDENITKLQFPVREYPLKVKGINLEKISEVKAVLKGIRGQYLLFEGGGALNVRAHSGYRVQISF